jgi:hypothetical protein
MMRISSASVICSAGRRRRVGRRADDRRRVVTADAVAEFVVEWVDKKLAPLDARLTELAAKLDSVLSRLDADAAKVIDLPEVEWGRERSRR